MFLGKCNVCSPVAVRKSRLSRTFDPLDQGRRRGLHDRVPLARLLLPVGHTRHTNVRLGGANTLHIANSEGQSPTREYIRPVGVQVSVCGVSVCSTVVSVEALCIMKRLHQVT